MKNKITILILVYLVLACSPSKVVLKNESLELLPNLSLSEAIELEAKKSSKEITPDYQVTIGDDIYPNKNGYKLAHKTYERIDSKEFNLQVEYFYSINDSSVKVTLYEWNDPSKMGLEFEKEKSNREIRNSNTAFRMKFNSIRDELIEIIGTPTTIEYNSKNNSEYFIDEIKWLGNDRLNADLFMLGNDKNEFRRIRLAVYKE